MSSTQQKNKQGKLPLIGRNKGETGKSPKGVEVSVAECHPETSVKVLPCKNLLFCKFFHNPIHLLSGGTICL